MIYILLTSKDSRPNTRKYAWEEGVEWEWTYNRHVSYLFVYKNFWVKINLEQF